MQLSKLRYAYLLDQTLALARFNHVGAGGHLHPEAVVVRIMRRIRPGLTPLYVALSLNIPARWRLFGTPAQVLDCTGIRPGMRVLEIGPRPGFFPIPLAQRVSTGEGGSVTCVELQPEMIAMLRERLRTSEVQNSERARFHRDITTCAISYNGISCIVCWIKASTLPVC